MSKQEHPGNVAECVTGVLRFSSAPDWRWIPVMSGRSRTNADCIGGRCTLVLVLVEPAALCSDDGRQAKALGCGAGGAGHDRSAGRPILIFIIGLATPIIWLSRHDHHLHVLSLQ